MTERFKILYKDGEVSKVKVYKSFDKAFEFVKKNSTKHQLKITSSNERN